jgi:hypothetical protein
VATDITSVAAARRNFRNVHPAENHLAIYGIEHWKNWLYELSVLAPISQTDAHSLFRSPSYMNTRTCVNTLLYYVLCERSFTAVGREISRKLNIM